MMSGFTRWSQPIDATFVAGGLNGFFSDPSKRDKLKPEAIWEIENGLRLSAVDFFGACMQRSAIYQAYRTLFQTYDLVAMPSAQVFPFDADLHWPREVAGVEMDSYHRWMEIVAGPSLAGCPTLSVPAGFGPEHMPSGIQIMGRHRQDLFVLQAGWAYEQAGQSVLKRLPPCLRN
jgi:amidase